MFDGDEDLRNGSEYDRGSSDESRRSEIEQNDEESDGQSSEKEAGEADAKQDERLHLNQDDISACAREGTDDDDDETTDSRGGDRRQDKLKALARLANEFNRTVKELRAEQRGKAFEFPRPAGRRTCPQRQESEYSDGDESESASSQRSMTPRKKVLAPWITIRQLMKEDHSKEQAYSIFAQWAQDEIAKAGPCVWTSSKAEDLGGFKKAHVNFFQSHCLITFHEVCSNDSLRHRATLRNRRIEWGVREFSIIARCDTDAVVWFCYASRNTRTDTC